MIIVELNGGLGNQMFQYALGRRTALVNKTILKLDVSLFSPKIRNPRSYRLAMFNIEERFASQEEINKVKASDSGLLGRALRRVGVPIPKHFWAEKYFHFDSEVLTAPNDSYFDNDGYRGWWQSPKYFAQVEATIRQDFTFRNGPRKFLSRLLRDVGNSDSIAVHVRRGDYVANERNLEFYGTLGKDYYNRALFHLTSKAKKAKVFFFSTPDGIAWAKKDLQKMAPTVFVSELTGFSDEEDLRLMAACKHQVIANSTFSWWAAWLNENPGKIVIAPKRWFNDPLVNDADLIPVEWVRL